MHRRRMGLAIGLGSLLALCTPTAGFAAKGDVWTVAGGGEAVFEGRFEVPTGDGGYAVQATFVSPWAATVDVDGTILVTDANTVRAVFPDGGIETIAGTTIAGSGGDGGPGVNALLSRPLDLELDPNGDLVIADTGNNRLRKLTPAGTMSTIAGGFSSGSSGIGDGGSLQDATLLSPTGVAFSDGGTLFIREGGRVRRVDNGTITTWASDFTSSGDIDVDSVGNVYVPDGAVLWRIDPSGQKSVFAGVIGGGGLAGDGVAATSARLDGVYQVAVSASGEVYYAESNTGRIRKVSSGVVTTVAGGGAASAATGCLAATNAASVSARALAFTPTGDLIFTTGKLVRTIALTDRACPTFSPLKPRRVLETRASEGQIGFTGAKPSIGQTVVLHLNDAAGAVPADATAVAINITATNSAVNGYVTAWPCEAERPTASNLNLDVGQTSANAALVALGDSNDVCLFDHAGADLIVDVTGYIGSNVPYQPLIPYRALETRTSELQFHYAGPKPAAGEIVRVPITGWGYGYLRTVSPFATAVALNITAVNATADGFVTVWSCDGPRPNASNINVSRGGTVAHLVISGLSAGTTQKSVCLYTQSGADLVIDVLGAFAPESPYVGTTPTRVLETRAEQGQIGYAGARPAGGQVVEVQVLGSGPNVAPPTARAVVLNVTATNTAAPGYVTVWPCGTERPLASTLNFSAADTQSNAVAVGVGTTGKVCIYTQSGADLIVDVNGFFA